MLKNLFSLKYGALVLLVLQNTFLVVFMGISRTAEGDMYASSTAVVCMELVKFVTCLTMIIAYEHKSFSGGMQALHAEIVAQPMQILHLAVPSFVYAVQNNVLYYALSHLDAATFQVGYNIKILTTAIFSVFMLNKKLSSLQWGSLFILTIGVAMAQYSSQNSKKGGKQNSTLGKKFVGIWVLVSCVQLFIYVFIIFRHIRLICILFHTLLNTYIHS